MSEAGVLVPELGGGDRHVARRPASVRRHASVPAAEQLRRDRAVLADRKSGFFSYK